MAITPDTKDWTWVLERPCPDCGLDTPAVDPTRVAGMVRDNAQAWQRVLADTPAVVPAPPPTCGRRSSTRATCATSSPCSTSGWP